MANLSSKHTEQVSSLVFQCLREYNALVGAAFRLTGTIGLAQIRRWLSIHNIHSMEVPLAVPLEQLTLEGMEIVNILEKQIADVLALQQWAQDVARAAMDIAEESKIYRELYSQLRKQQVFPYSWGAADKPKPPA